MDTYEGVTVKALLDSGVTGMFMDRKMVAKYRFRLQKLERPVVVSYIEKIVRWVVNNKEDWEREEEVEADYKKIEEMVPRRFLKWRKVFRKMGSERIPTRKIWDHAIDLKETFKL